MCRLITFFSSFSIFFLTFAFSQEKENDVVFDFTEETASFPGGSEAMKKYLDDNIKYPEIAMEIGDQGKVYAEFVVNRDGSIEQLKILRGVSREIDDEAKRVILSMPK